MFINIIKILKLFKQNFRSAFRSFCKSFVKIIVDKNIAHVSKQDLFVGLMLSSFIINILGLVLPFTIIQMYDRVIPNKAYSTFAAFMIIIFIVLIVEAILKIMRGFVSASLDVKLGYSMSLYGYKTAVKADLIAFEREPFSVQIDRFNFINSLKEYYSGQYLIAVCDAPFVIFYFIFFYCIQFYVGLSVTIVCLILLAISYLQATKLKNDQLHKAKDSQIVSKFLVELLSGVKTIKTLGLEAQMLRRYERLQKTHVVKEFQFIQEKMSTGKNINIISQVVVITAVMVSCYTIFKNYMTMGGMAACILLAGKIMQPVAGLITLMIRWKHFAVANQEFSKFINIAPEILNPNITHKQLTIINGEIVLNNMNYFYVDHNGNKNLIFENVNFTVPAKKTIAIHGDRLCGKSTLIHILAGLFKIEGVMQIDGEDLNNLDLDGLRKQIALISETSTLFQGTILENLTRFTELELKKVQELCMDIGLHTVIQAMPNGYQTVVGVDDALTKGIKQAIIIARELIKEPKIILFDQINIELDLEIDFILNKILNLQKNKTTMVIISNRPSLLLMADQHYLIKNKRIINMDSNISANNTNNT